MDLSKRKNRRDTGYGKGLDMHFKSILENDIKDCNVNVLCHIKNGLFDVVYIAIVKTPKECILHMTKFYFREICFHYFQLLSLSLIC